MRFDMGLGRVMLLISSTEIIIINLVTRLERWRRTKGDLVTKRSDSCVCVSRHIKDTPSHKKQYIVSLHLLLFYDKFDVQ